MCLNKEMVVLGVSLVVIAAVVIGVVAGIDNTTVGVGTWNNNTTLDAICAQTDYKESCISSLKPVGKESEVIVYFKAAVNATVSEMALAMEKLKVEGGTLSDEGELMALQDCMELLDLCTKELESVNMLVNSTPKLFYNDSVDARSSLSAVITYQRTCREGFKEFESTYNMDGVLQRSSELSSNALAIIYEHSENDDKEAESLVPPRRSTNELQGGLYDGYPAQMILAGDRKLMLQYHSFWKLDGQAPNAVVAQDGSGQYTTIFAAIQSYPNGHKGRYLIYVKHGVYYENVIIAKNMTNIFMYGDGLNKTIIAGYFMDGTAYRRATLSVIGDGFFCKDIGITVPTQYGGYTAAAVKVLSDKAAFFNCRIIGTTSSIFALAHRQFFRNCEIYGATNIVSGDAALVIQHSDIIVTESNLNGKASIIASQARSDRRESTGFVIHGCNIYRDKSNNNHDDTDQTPKVQSATTYLGMAAKKYSRTIVMESSLGDLIRPEGWYGSPDDRNHATEHVTFVEYGNRGPGAQTKMRVNWPGYAFISKRDYVLRYTAGRFIQAQNWLQGTVVPFQEGFFS
ncbi:pectinesterase-like [Juglans microcarpa x Juglans regia]|uniref:pectinesterase-like n=1 Tax=Juglans microcarpa x Juglans regia TaxID=2249226 RepID=UPI001B7DEA9A|nr:pectinesterase-like [Juglans microcarpa x Juglans regia]